MFTFLRNNRSSTEIGSGSYKMRKEYARHESAINSVTWIRVNARYAQLVQALDKKITGLLLIVVFSPKHYVQT